MTPGIVLLLERETLWLVGGVLGVLAVVTGFGQVLKRRTDTGLNPEAVRVFHLRVRSYWLIYSVMAATFLFGKVLTVILFGAIAFWALREFVTLTPTRPADHRALFWVFFVFTPLQFLLVGMEQYGAYSVLIPVYAFLFVPARAAFGGDYKRFLERAAKIQSGLMICVYCLSYAPALLTLNVVAADPATGSGPVALAGEEGDAGERTTRPAAEPKSVDEGTKTRLLFYFVLIVQLGDVFTFLWEKWWGKHVIAAAINPNKTWEGFAGGVASATLVGAALYKATPFTPWSAAGLSLLAAVMGFAGGLTMSAIKRDRGVRDYGTLVEGHGGVLDRIDSICFAAPVFFHAVRAFFTA